MGTVRSVAMAGLCVPQAAWSERQAVMRSVEQLAEQQRARLDELQAGHLALEAALQALLVGSEEAAKEALKYKSPKSVAVRPAEAAPGRPQLSSPPIMIIAIIVIITITIKLLLLIS